MIATIPANNNHDPLILPKTSDSDTSDNKDQNEDEENNHGNLSDNDHCEGMAKKLTNWRRD
jgi:hypothetical protein